MEGDPRPPAGDIARAFAVGREAWPGVDLTLEDFANDLARLPQQLGDIPDAILQDLFLARACARNVPGALRNFRASLFAVVVRAIKTFDDSPAFHDEVFQQLSEVMFVGNAANGPRIARYIGQGPLAAFVGKSARRIALRTSGNAARFKPESALVDLFSQAHGQESMILKQHHREIFNRALAVALRELSNHDRLVLRLNVVQRVSTTRIATMYKVSQPTVSRWIQRSARTIFSNVKDLVCDELDIDTRELESMLLLVRSQIEVTISHAAGGSPPPSR